MNFSELDNNYWIVKPIRKSVHPIKFYLIHGSEMISRYDLEIDCGPFPSGDSTEKEARRRGYELHDLVPLFLDFFEEDCKTVWCWKDEDTSGSSQLFNSKKSALNAWRKDKLVLNPYPYD